MKRTTLVWRVMCAAWCVWCASAAAETIRMRNGAYVQGKIIKETSEELTIDIAGWGPETVKRADIERIEADGAPVSEAPAAAAQAPAPSLAAPPATPVPLTAQGQSVNMPMVKSAPATVTSRIGRSVPATPQGPSVPRSEPLHANVFYLATGPVVHGTIVSQNEREVVVDVPDYGEMHVERDQIIATELKEDQPTSPARHAAASAPTFTPSPARPPVERQPGPPPSAGWERLMKQQQVTGTPTPWQEIRKTPEWKQLDAKFRGPDGRLRRDAMQSGDPSGWGAAIELQFWMSGMSTDEQDQVMSTPSIDQLERQFGADSTRFHDLLNAEAGRYLMFHDYAKAAPCLKRLVALEEKLWGAGPAVAERLDAYAETLDHVGNTQEAAAARARAKAIRSNPDAAHPQVAGRR